jgi:streptomycin 6-kinase
MLHGDFYPSNILSAEREPWLAVDPMPMLGNAAYDAVQYLLFRGGNVADRATEWSGHVRRVSSLFGVDQEDVRAWMFGKLVHDALWAAEQGDTGWRGHLDVALIASKLQL